MSVACSAGHYRHTNRFTIIFYDGIVSEGFTWECSFCLIITYAKVRVLNKTQSKINLNYLLIAHDNMG